MSIRRIRRRPPILNDRIAGFGPARREKAKVRLHPKKSASCSGLKSSRPSSFVVICATYPASFRPAVGAGHDKAPCSCGRRLAAVCFTPASASAWRDFCALRPKPILYEARSLTRLFVSQFYTAWTHRIHHGHARYSVYQPVRSTRPFSHQFGRVQGSTHGFAISDFGSSISIY